MGGQQDTPTLEKGLTFRSAILGLAMVAFISVAGPWGLMAASLNFTWSFFPIGVGAPFMLLIFANALGHGLTGRWALTRAEMVTILVMGLVVTGMPLFFVGCWVAVISAPYYDTSTRRKTITAL